MTFLHQDEGTAEADWAAAIERMRGELRQVGPGFFADVAHLVVVSAHPDDETLGAGGLLATAYAAGVRTTVIVATSGEASHPDSSTHRPDQLAHLREAETLSAVEALDPGAQVHFLRIPDGQVSEPGHLTTLQDAIATAIGTPSGADPDTTLVVTPWSGDRHPDHAAAAQAAQAAAQPAKAAATIGTGDDSTPAAVLVWGYPVWAWHWGAPSDLPWQDAVVVPLAESALGAKERALTLHATQVEPLSGLPGDEVLLHEGMLAHFRRPLEVFFDAQPGIRPAESQATRATRDTRATQDTQDTQGPATHDPAALDAWFEQLHTRADDPWGFETRWYEERKRAVLLASLPDRDYGSVLELGCSTGVLSRELAGRTRDRFLGVDVSERALDRARARNADLSKARFERMHIPSDWPDGGFDLVVLSELGYYLEPAELDLLAERVARILPPGGAFVLCHWRHPVEGRPFSGDGVHARFADRPEFDRLVRHEEEDFVLDVLVPRPAVSVARREEIV